MDERGIVSSDVVVSEEYHLTGTIVGDVVVERTGVFQAHGLVTGDITIQPGGIATIDGTVEGQVTNHGHVYVTGVITGSVKNAGGSLHVEPQGVVTGQIYEER